MILKFLNKSLNKLTNQVENINYDGFGSFSLIGLPCLRESMLSLYFFLHIFWVDIN